MRGTAGFSVTWSTRMFLCFACGILAGTGAAVLLGEEICGRLEELGLVAGDFSSAGRGMEENFQTCWQYLLRRRFTGFFVGGLIFSTPLAAWAGMCLFFCAGFYGALAISVYTLERGWRGLFLFVRAVFPHWLIYGAVWVMLAILSSKGIGRLRFRIWLLFAVAVALGCFLEALFRFYLI